MKENLELMSRLYTDANWVIPILVVVSIVAAGAFMFGTLRVFRFFIYVGAGLLALCAVSLPIAAATRWWVFALIGLETYIYNFYTAAVCAVLSLAHIAVNIIARGRGFKAWFAPILGIAAALAYTALLALVIDSSLNTLFFE